MQVIHLDASALPQGILAAPEPAALTIGKFDGVHLGHVALLQAVRATAAADGIRSAAVVLDPHPLTVLRPQMVLRLLSSTAEKLWLLRRAGLDLVIVWKFDSATAQLGPEAFLSSLTAAVLPRALVIGPGFALGKGRGGDEVRLRHIGAAQGFAVQAIAPAIHPGMDVAVQSTTIRSRLTAGDVAAAGRLLGHPPTLHGRVSAGDRRGRLLGFPTANLDPLLPNPALPADGVYAGWVELRPLTAQRTWHAAVANLGVRPTFAGRRYVVEAHLLDFTGDLYGQPLRLHFAERLRGERRFASTDELQQQITADVAAARTLLSDQMPPESSG